MFGLTPRKAGKNEYLEKSCARLQAILAPWLRYNIKGFGAREAHVLRFILSTYLLYGRAQKTEAGQKSLQLLVAAQRGDSARGRDVTADAKVQHLLTTVKEILQAQQGDKCASYTSADLWAVQ